MLLVLLGQIVMVVEEALLLEVEEDMDSTATPEIITLDGPITTMRWTINQQTLSYWVVVEWMRMFR